MHMKKRLLPIFSKHFISVKAQKKSRNTANRNDYFLGVNVLIISNIPSSYDKFLTKIST